MIFVPCEPSPVRQPARLSGYLETVESTDGRFARNSSLIAPMLVATIRVMNPSLERAFNCRGGTRSPRKGFGEDAAVAPRSTHRVPGKR